MAITDYPATKWFEARLKPGDGHHHKFAAYIRGYELMAKAKVYRPEAPSDGLGGILLDKDALADQARLREEAIRFAHKMWEQDEAGRFEVHGCPDSAAMTLLALSLALCELTFGGWFSDGALSRMAALIVEEANRVESSSVQGVRSHHA